MGVLNKVGSWEGKKGGPTDRIYLERTILKESVKNGERGDNSTPQEDQVNILRRQHPVLEEIPMQAGWTGGGGYTFFEEKEGRGICGNTSFTSTIQEQSAPETAQERK